MKWERAKSRKQEAGIAIIPKGRPRKYAEPRDIIAELDYEIRRWRIPKSFQPRFLCRNTKLQMGDRYFLYSYQTGRIVPVHDPGSVRQQHCGVQERNGAKRGSCSGYHSPSNEARKKDLHLRSDQGAQYASQAYFELTQQIRHYAFDFNTWEAV